MATSFDNGKAAGDILPITPSDSTDLAKFPRALDCLESGLVCVVPADAADDTPRPIFLNAGSPYPLRVRRVMETDTAATGIFGLI